jgi:hypothetical protein
MGKEDAKWKETGFIAGVLLAVAAWLGFWVLSAYVIWHFISKFW